MALEPTLSSLAVLAASASSSSTLPVDFNSSAPQFHDASSADGHKTQTKEQLRRHHVRALHKVIDESDVVLLVLDARDPEGCRSKLVEEEVRRRESEGKRLVFVLNKIGTLYQFTHAPGEFVDSIRAQISFLEITHKAGYATYGTLRLRCPFDLPPITNGQIYPRPRLLH